MQKQIASHPSILCLMPLCGWLDFSRIKRQGILCVVKTMTISALTLMFSSVLAGGYGLPKNAASSDQQILPVPFDKLGLS